MANENRTRGRVPPRHRGIRSTKRSGVEILPGTRPHRSRYVDLPGAPGRFGWSLWVEHQLGGQGFATDKVLLCQGVSSSALGWLFKSSLGTNVRSTWPKPDPLPVTSLSTRFVTTLSGSRARKSRSPTHSCLGILTFRTLMLLRLFVIVLLTKFLSTFAKFA